MSFNIAKTQCLAIGSRKRLKDISDGRVAQSALVVNDENASTVENIKYLGVIVDAQLSWEEQLSAITKGVSRRIRMLHFSKSYQPIATVQNHTLDMIAPYGELRVSILSINCRSSKAERQQLSQTVPMMPSLFPSSGNLVGSR